MQIQELTISVLTANEPDEKTNAAQYMADCWKSGKVGFSNASQLQIPLQPGRPSKPDLVPPAKVMRRRLGSIQGRQSLLHAIAHIEFNAINLAADLLARFSNNQQISDKLRETFISDWVKVCADEARHFKMISERLSDLGSYYGAFPAHNGLWEAALSTENELIARLVIAPMVLEARGLDVTPGMIEKFMSVDDAKSADILNIIYEEEIPHVATGTRWFLHICEQKNLPPKETIKLLVQNHYKGTLKPPFNHEARALAGLPSEFYQL